MKVSSVQTFLKVSLVLDIVSYEQLELLETKSEISKKQLKDKSEKKTETKKHGINHREINLVLKQINRL